MSPSQLRYFVYGTVLSVSLVSLSVSAGPADGVFGDYFSNIITDSAGCGTNTAITGFMTTAGTTFGTQKCNTFQTIVKSVLGSSSTAPDGQAVIGLNTDGSLKYGSVSGGDGTSVGTISAFNLSSCPTGWTLANGSSGTPDLRGEFIRGLDSGRGVDAGRTLGSWQMGTHSIVDDDAYLWSPALGISSTSQLIDLGYEPASLLGNLTFTSNTAGNPGAVNSYATTTRTSRPRNVALLYCMKISGGASTPSNNTTWTNTTGNSNGDIIQATTGNVGIGTTNPGVKLEVAGTIKSTTQVITPQLCLAGDCKTAWPTAGTSATWSSLTGKPFDASNNAWLADISANNISTNGNIQAAGSPVPANWYNIQAGSIGASTLYGYNGICTGNQLGNCTGNGGVVLNPYGSIGIGGNPETTAWGMSIHKDDWAIVTRKADGGDNSEPGASRGSIYTNDIFLRSAGKWVSQMGGSPSGTRIPMYQCPGPVSLGGGAWGYYGCQNQIQNQPTCYEVEYPSSATFSCYLVGYMRLEP